MPSLMKVSRGFTLIELIVTITIVAIIAVVVAPRFINFQDDAQENTVAVTFASFESALNFAHAKWQVNGGGSEGMNNMPGYANNELDMNDVGYPIGTQKGEPMGQPHNIGQGNQGCHELFLAIVSTEYSFSHRNRDSDSVDFITQRRTYSFNDANGVAQNKLALCYYIYTKKGYNSDPSQAEIVYWYNSRTGQVTTTEP